MIMAMVKIDRETKERELLWTPDMNEIEPMEEIEAALAHFGDEIVYGVNENNEEYVTGKKFHIVFEQVG